MSGTCNFEERRAATNCRPCVLVKKMFQGTCTNYNSCLLWGSLGGGVQLGRGGVCRTTTCDICSLYAGRGHSPLDSRPPPCHMQESGMLCLPCSAAVRKLRRPTRRQKGIHRRCTGGAGRHVCCTAGCAGKRKSLLERRAAARSKLCIYRYGRNVPSSTLRKAYSYHNIQLEERRTAENRQTNTLVKNRFKIQAQITVPFHTATHQRSSYVPDTKTTSVPDSSMSTEPLRSERPGPPEKARTIQIALTSNPVDKDRKPQLTYVIRVPQDSVLASCTKRSCHTAVVHAEPRLIQI